GRHRDGAADGRARRDHRAQTPDRPTRGAMSNPMSISNNVPGTRPLVLVIGAPGALGALVADPFRRHGWAVRQSSRDPIPPPDFHYVDLTDPATLAPALDGVDLVITTAPAPP